MADAKSRAYIFKIVSTMLGESSKAVEDSALDELVAQFLEAKVVEGKKVDKLLFYAQDKTVICTTGDKEPLTGKCAYVVRVTDEGKPVTVAENDINFGTINGDSTETLQTLTQLMSNVFDPCLASNLFGYVKKMKPNEKEELEALQKKCVVVIDKAIQSLQGGLELAKLDPSDKSLEVRAGTRSGWKGRVLPRRVPTRIVSTPLAALPPAERELRLHLVSRSRTSRPLSKQLRPIPRWWPSWKAW